ncbi:hypothetical protein Fmac_021395 [Flemingia macrophylla]|uniref:C-JID domain-containing protein n=1 Tax=Flemingia macrophylla TaxID=520843 RepID=A0ABD1LWR2_9FABA
MDGIINPKGWSEWNHPERKDPKHYISPLPKPPTPPPPPLYPQTLHLPNLRRLDLSDSKNLIKVPDLGEALNLRMLILSGCVKLMELHPSIGYLRKLSLLNLGVCTSLINLPHFKENLNLEKLHLEGCIQLREITPSIGLLQKLTFLDLRNCQNLVTLPNSILHLSSLEYLYLSFCPKLFNNQLLHESRDEEHMEKLCVGEDPIGFHSGSTTSIMKRCFMLPSLKGSISWLLPSSTVVPCLRELNLSSCNLVSIPDAIRNLHFLEFLNLEENNFATVPSLKELSKLYFLNLKYCRQLKYLPEFPSQTNLSSKVLQLPKPIIVPPIAQRETVESCIYGETAGLNTFGCTELVEMGRCTNMAFSWTIQLLQAHYQFKRLPCYDRFLQCISSIIPGSEIPSWFNNQHEGTGSFITIHESPLMQQSNNCIGLLCCLVFPSLSGSKILSCNPARTITIPLFWVENRVSEDHLWLFYLKPPQSTVTGCHAHSKLRIDIKTYGYALTIEVKKYGYRWIYEKDLESIKL